MHICIYKYIYNIFNFVHSFILTEFVQESVYKIYICYLIITYDICML